jgi:L-gulono-1,4-lactone dehydrogenase
MTWTNWAGDESCRPAAVERPGSVDELSDVVRQATAAGRTVRAVGAGHSFGDLVPTSGTIVSLDALSGLLGVDAAAGLARVAAGTRLGDLSVLLAAHGLALANLGDIDRQSVGGAMSTATHGTGRRLGNLATQIEALDIMLADGSLLAVTPDDPEVLRAARVSIGALGIITSYTLRVVPAFRLRCEHHAAPLGETIAGLDEAVGRNDHYEFFVFPHASQAWTKATNRTSEPTAGRGRLRRYLSDIVVENHLLDALCRVGRAQPRLIPRLNRLITGLASDSVRIDDSYRIFPATRGVRFTETEWALPRAAGADALRDLLAMIGRRRFDVNFPLEVRFVAADEESFLSPSYGRETAYIAAHMYRGMEWAPFFGAVQEIALAYDGRPHWGKRHSLQAADLAQRYPAWNRFQDVRARLDPAGRFTNDHVRRVLGAVSTARTQDGATPRHAGLKGLEHG